MIYNNLFVFNNFFAFLLFLNNFSHFPILTFSLFFFRSQTVHWKGELIGRTEREGRKGLCELFSSASYTLIDWFIFSSLFFFFQWLSNPSHMSLFCMRLLKIWIYNDFALHAINLPHQVPSKKVTIANQSRSHVTLSFPLLPSFIHLIVEMASSGDSAEWNVKILMLNTYAISGYLGLKEEKACVQWFAGIRRRVSPWAGFTDIKRELLFWVF